VCAQLLHLLVFVPPLLQEASVHIPDPASKQPAAIAGQPTAPINAMSSGLDAVPHRPEVPIARSPSPSLSVTQPPDQLPTCILTPLGTTQTQTRTQNHPRPPAARGLREIGYQSFCNFVCNLKFMKHIPFDSKDAGKCV